MGPLISVFGSQVSPRLMSSLRVGMPVAGCQVGVAKISGQMALPLPSVRRRRKSRCFAEELREVTGV